MVPLLKLLSEMRHDSNGSCELGIVADTDLAKLAVHRIYIKIHPLFPAVRITECCVLIWWNTLAKYQTLRPRRKRLL